MTGRYLFAKYTKGVWTHNLHILPYNDEFYMRNEFLLRDYLREHPELVAEYGGVKKRAVIKNGNTMEEYTRSKTEFIQKVIDGARKEKGLPLQSVWEN
ncbi:GrpB family protein [Anaerocolumna aminovalerica]|uniref:GrpB family protein n=1 Tax=Anaerocolumna aminovalerica TaxID=1527 RepID=UPI000BE41B55|nr:GrpB family protein [Anaerocolumna aminovalerica]